MKTMKNRILSGAMAGVLAMSLAVPAFAADNTTVVTGSYKAVTIDVTVPTTGTAFINPYGLDLDVDDGASGTVTIKGQQIVSAPMAIKNESAMDLSVTATVTGEIDLTATDMKLATSSTKGSGSEGDADYVAPATSKSAFVYLQAKQEPALTGSTVAANDVAAKCAAWGASAYDAATDVIVGTRAVTKDNLVTLRAANVNAGTFTSYNAGSVALFRLTGDCVAAPRASEWKTTDTFKTTIAFTFLPATIEKYAITEGTHTGTAVPTVTFSTATAAEGDTVTITATGVAAADNTVVAIVTPETGNPINVTMTKGSSDWTGTFTMPASPVTVAINATA